MPSSCRLVSCMLVTVLAVAALQGCAAVPRGPVVTGIGNPLPGSDQAQAKAGKLVQLADAAASAGNPDAAAGMYEEAALLDPTSRAAALGLGDALLRLGRPGPAGEAFERALRGRADARAQLGYGRALLALNRPEVAIDHLENARSLAPRDVATLKALGVAYDQSGRHADAASAYRAGLALKPDDEALRTNLGLSLALGGDGPGAIAILKPVAEAPGADARARQNLALAYGLAGELAAAERLSQIDLGADDVRHNLAIFATLSAVDGPTAARALSPLPSDDVLPRASAPVPAAPRAAEGGIRRLRPAGGRSGPRPLLGGNRQGATAPTATAGNARAVAGAGLPTAMARTAALPGGRAVPTIADAPAPASGPEALMRDKGRSAVRRDDGSAKSAERADAALAQGHHPAVAATINAPKAVPEGAAGPDVTTADDHHGGDSAGGRTALAAPGAAGDDVSTGRAIHVVASGTKLPSPPAAPAGAVPPTAGPVIMLAIPPPSRP